MNYHNITKCDMLNGEGIRVVLWVSGCSHHCEECHNKITWNPSYGLLFDESAQQEIFNELKKDYVAGLTISGGDPLHVDNRKAVHDLVMYVKNVFPEKTIWIYTGYQYHEVANLELMKYIDVLVDGKYDSRFLPSEWVGSCNQNVIRLKHES